MQEYIGSFFRTAFIFFYFSKKKPSTEISSSIPEEKNCGISRENIFHTKQKGKGSADKERLGGLEDTVTPWRVV